MIWGASLFSYCFLFESESCNGILWRTARMLRHGGMMSGLIKAGGTWICSLQWARHGVWRRKWGMQLQAEWANMEMETLGHAGFDERREVYGDENQWCGRLRHQSVNDSAGDHGPISLQYTPHNWRPPKPSHDAHPSGNCRMKAVLASWYNRTDGSIKPEIWKNHDWWDRKNIRSIPRKSSLFLRI